MSHYSKRGSVKTPIPKKTEILSIFSELDSAKIPHDSNSLKRKYIFFFVSNICEIKFLKNKK